MAEELSLALSLASRRRAKQSKANAAGVDNSQPSELQVYMREKLIEMDPAWKTMEPYGIRALNRRFGRLATTEALQRMVEEVRDGLEARNPFALLWAVTSGRVDP